MLNIGTMNAYDPNGNSSNKIYKPSGELDAAALIVTGFGIVGALIATTDGINDALLICYDGTDTNGTIVARCPVKGTDTIGGMVIPFRVANGIYCTITGTGAKYHVYYL